MKHVDVFPFAHTPEGLQFLLLRRAPNNTFPGIWQPVAGKIKSGEKAWQAGLRELNEETGYDPVNFYALDHVSTYYLHTTDEVIHVPAFIAEVSFEPPLLNHEHDDFQWLTLEAAVNTASWQPYRKALLSIPYLLDSSPSLALAKISLKNKNNHLNP